MPSATGHAKLSPYADPPPAAASRLRLHGVYDLPDGSRWVVGAGGGSHYFLYHPASWASQTWVINLPIAFEVTSEGALVTGKGTRTFWHVEHLADTGLTVDRH